MKRNITKTVDEISKLEITGNIIPEQWFNTIVKETQRGIKPYLEAIVILSDIVYWYKPAYIRDELSGKLVEIRKKFKSDKLQKSYQSISEKFGFSKKVTAQACKHLSDIGVIDIEYRNIKTAFTVCTNVTFIDINIDKLKDITFPNGIDHLAEMGNMVLPKSDRPINRNRQDVYIDYKQEITTKNTDIDNTSLSSFEIPLNSDQIAKLTLEYKDSTPEEKENIEKLFEETIYYWIVEYRYPVWISRSRNIRDNWNVTEQELLNAARDYSQKNALMISSYKEPLHALNIFYKSCNSQLEKRFV